MTIKQFQIPNAADLQNKLEYIRNRVAAYQWFDAPEIEASQSRWIYGTDMQYLKEFQQFWLDSYKWQDTADELNKFPHFTADIDGQKVHFIHEQGSGQNPRALLLSHGWPGSVYEFMQIIEPLAHPERYGGDAEDGVSVVAPSLIGYGWSQKPKTIFTQFAIAELFDKLMREALGYTNYIAQGGDWGSVISSAIALNHSVKNGGGCEALHINMYGLRGTNPPESEQEKQWAAQAGGLARTETAYLQLQGTKPQSLGYAMMDSPLGAAAWILEKFHGWSDLQNNNIESRYTKQQLLSNIMIYLTTDTFNSATWLYRALFDSLPHIPADTKIEVPCGVADFGDPIFLMPPRSMLEKDYNIVHWNKIERGGHFAAMSAPELFVNEVQNFLTKI